MQNAYRATWAATVTTKARPAQMIRVYWRDRAPAYYPAATLAEILADPAGIISYIADADTGEIIHDPENGYTEIWADINDTPAIILYSDGIETCYTWTPYNGIRTHNDYGSAYAYLEKRGWRY